MKKFALITAVLIFLVLGLWRLHPLTQVIGDGGDNLEFFAFMHIAKQNIIQTGYPFGHTDIMRYPMGFNFGSGYDGSFATLSGALLSFLMPLELAYNTTVVLIVFLNIYVTFYFFSKIRKLFGLKESPLFTYLCALFFAWSPYIVARIQGHLNLAFVVGFPIFGYYAISIFRSFTHSHHISEGDLKKLFLSILLIALGSLQYLVFLAQIVPCIVVYLILTHQLSLSSLKNATKNIQLAHLLPVIVFCGAVFLFLYGGYISDVLTGNLSTQGIFRNVRDATPALIDVFIPNSFIAPLFGSLNPSSIGIEKVTGIGLSGILILVIYALREKKRAHLVSAFVIILATVLVHLWVPLLFIPNAARIIIFTSLSLSILFLLRLDSVVPRAALLLLFVPFLIERGAYIVRITPPFPKAVSDIVQGRPGKAVLNIPIQSTGFHASSPYYYRKSIVDGYFHHPADTAYSRLFINQEPFRFFQCDKSVNPPLNPDLNTFAHILAANDIRTIVVYKSPVYGGNKWFFDDCTKARFYWDSIMPPTIPFSVGNETSILRFETGRGVKDVQKTLFDGPGTFRLFAITVDNLDNEVLSVELDDLALAQSETNVSSLENNKKRVTLLFADEYKDISSQDSHLLIKAQPLSTDSSSTWVTLEYQMLPSVSGAVFDRPISKITVNNDYEIYAVKGE